MSEQVHVRRCHVCGKEILVRWGPEGTPYAEAARMLREHIGLHTKVDLMDYVLRMHFSRDKAAGGGDTGDQT